jgi:dihydrodipicolinate synthase/N-acetylneuraminate lyase
MSCFIEGVIVPIITPMDIDGNIDFRPIKHQVDFLINNGISGLLTCGTTGEGPLLSLQERFQFSEAVINAVESRIPVIVHSGAITTEDTKQLTRHAMENGAQAAAIIPPYYYHYSDESIIAHYESVVNSVSDFPIYLYNNPFFAGNQLSYNVVKTLVRRCPNIIGIKDSSNSDLLINCLNLSPGKFNTANGSDVNILKNISSGVDACISGNANVIPELIVQLYKACRKKDTLLASELQAKVDFIHTIFDGGNNLSLYKNILNKRGIMVGDVRKPLPQITLDEKTRIWQQLVSAELIRECR